MRTSAGKPGTQSAQGEFSFAPPDTASLISLDQCLREVEAGTAALNLHSDCVSLAAEIAAFDPDLDTEQHVALILLIVISLAALEEGSTRFPATGPDSIQPMRRMLGPLCGDAFWRRRSRADENSDRTNASSRLGRESDSELDLTTSLPLLYLQPFIYQQRILCAERALARKLADLLKAPRIEVDDRNIQNLLAEFATQSRESGRFDLSAEQRVAIECAATAPLTISFLEVPAPARPRLCWHS